MKRSIVFTLFLLAIVGSAFATTNSINLYQDPIPPQPNPRSLTLCPASATISETDLAVYFDWSVGNATITVYDEANNMVDQIVVDTNSTAEVYIDNTTWNSGNYTIKISYGTTHLIGYFQIQ